MLGVCLSMLGAVDGQALTTEPIDQLPLEALLDVQVESAAQYVQPLSETPYPVTVISAQDIQRYGFRDLGEALQLGRGVYLSRDRAYTYLGVRGFSPPGDYNTRVLLMLDGARVNDPLYDQAMLGNESPISVDWIKRLEYVSGPASASYGGNALFGAVNAVLWNGADINGTRLTLDAAAGRSGQIGVLSGGVTQQGADWLLGLTIYDSQGGDLYFHEYNTPATNRGRAVGLDGEHYIKALFKGSLDGWRLGVSFSSRNKDVPTAYYGSLFNAAGNFIDDRALNVDLSHTRPLGEHWSELLRFHWGNTRYVAEYPYAGYINRDEANANWLRGEYRLNYVGFAGHRLLLGGEVSRIDRLGQRNFDISPSVSYLDDQRQATRAALFVQDEWQISSRWLANAGLRFDHQSEMSDMYSPRLSVIYRPSDQFAARLLAGQAFRYPNVYERYYQDGNLTQKANPDLKPEKIRTLELGGDYWLSRGVRLGASRYHYRIDDLIEQVVDPSDGLKVFANREGISADGWDFEIETLFTSGWRLRSGVSLIDAQQRGGSMVNSPRHLGKLLVDGPLPWSEQWVLGLNLQAVGTRASQAEAAPGYVTTNVTLGQRKMSSLGRWSFSVYNLGGKRYWDPAGREFTQDLLPSDRLSWRLRWELAL